MILILFIPTNPSQFCLNNLKIYIINLESRSDRKQQIETQLKTQNITNYEFIKAINGKELNVDDLQKQNIISKSDLKKGVYGCYLSHYNVLQKIVNDPNVQYGIIFEDDIILSDNFIEKFNRIVTTIQNTQASWDILYLDINCFNDKCKKGNYISPTIYYSEEMIWGAQAYLVNKDVAKKLLNILMPIKTPYDVELMEQCHGNSLKCLVLNEKIIHVSNFDDSDTIGIK